MLQGSLDSRALFTDQTEQFVQVSAIGASRKEEDKRYVVRIRLRAAAGEIRECYLMTESGDILMQPDLEDGRFVFYAAEVITDDTPVRYAFRLILAETGEEILYKRTGALDADGELILPAEIEQVLKVCPESEAELEEEEEEFPVHAAARRGGAHAGNGTLTGENGGSQQKNGSRRGHGKRGRMSKAALVHSAQSGLISLARRAGLKEIEAEPQLPTHGWWYVAPGFKTPDWAKGAVLYQIFTDRFCNGDPDNDVVTGEYYYNGGRVEKVEDWYCPPAPDDTREHYGGDLQGIMDKLDYLEELGIDGIYLNPIFVSPSNHKYDTQDYSHIDPHFGKIVHDSDETIPIGAKDNKKAGKYRTRVTDPANLEASDRLFANFVREAHMRGIRVILDGVFNNCGSFHRWMDREKIYQDTYNNPPGAFGRRESPYREYFDFKKDKWPDNDSYESWWGTETLPKLNYEESEELCEEILRVAAKWVSPPYYVDGWRLDVASDLGHSEPFNHEFWMRFREVVKQANPDAIILAENYVDSAHWLRGGEWDTIMNYEGFMEPVTWFLTGMEKHSDAFSADLLGDADRFWESMSWKTQDDMPQEPLMCSMNQLSNHDHSRFLTRTGLKVGRLSDLGTNAAAEGVRESVYREAAVLQMTWPGAPTLYYGDEAGLCGFTDPDNRRTYPWGREDKEMIRFHKELIRMHKELKCLRGGAVIRLADARNLLSYGRFDGSSSVVVIINNSDDTIRVRIPVVYAGVPENTQMKLRFMTTQNGFVAYAGRNKAVPVVDGMLEMELTPESSAVLVR